MLLRMGFRVVCPDLMGFGGTVKMLFRRVVACMIRGKDTCNGGPRPIGAETYLGIPHIDHGHV